MRATPAALTELRLQTAQSYRWRAGNRTFTEAEREALSDTARAQTRWAADPELLERLIAAEQAWTATHEGAH